MMDVQRLLGQFLGQFEGSQTTPHQPSAPSRGLGGIAGGAAVGGVLGMVMGNKKARKTLAKMTGGLAGVGGGAALGALAMAAYKNWQQNNGQKGGASRAKAPPSGVGPESLALDGEIQQISASPRHLAFEVYVVKAMIAAANADGHIDAVEQRAIFDNVTKLPLDSDEKALIFDTLSNPPGVKEIASYANGPDQASALYMASRLAIDPDHPTERAYLQSLAKAMELPPGLPEHLEETVMQHQLAS